MNKKKNKPEGADTGAGIYIRNIICTVKCYGS